MIFTFTNADKGFDSIFHGKEIDIKDWRSVIPNIGMQQATLFDPQTAYDFYDPSSYKNGVSYVGSLYLYNTITSVRLAVGKLAGVVGFLKKEFPNISNIFSENADNAEFIFKAVNSIINSELFQRGLDAIGAIPIVGWIIKLIAKIAESIYKVVDHIAKNKIENTKKELIGQPWIPLAEFNPDTDETLNKFLLEKIADSDLDWLYSPRNYFEKMEDFNVQREKRTENDSPLEKTDFFNITSYHLESHGLGFIPGGTVIAGPMRFPTSACNEVLNGGVLYPTATNTSAAVYQMLQSVGPGLFSIYPDKIIPLWDTTIDTMLEYAKNSVKLGWTCSPTGEFNTNKFKCNSDTQGKYTGEAGKKCKRKLQHGDIVPLPSGMQGHYTALLEYISTLFFEPGISATEANVQNGKTIPHKALNVIKQRQYAAIDSINCMYVDDSLAKPGLPRFSAIYNDLTLKNKWKNNVAAVLNSKEAWKKVVFWDVPQGPIREQLRQLAISNNIDPEKPGELVPQKMGIKIPSVLPDPKIPAPFVPKGPTGGAILSGKKASSTKTNQESSSMLPIVLAGAGVAYFFMGRNK